jgi:hypothetical protein
MKPNRKVNDMMERQSSIPELKKTFMEMLSAIEEEGSS